MPVNLQEVKKIVDILKKNDINIIDEQVTNNGDVVLTANNILFLYEPDINKINISFHVSIRPDISAITYKNLSNDLDEILNNVAIMDTYHFNMENKLIYGEAAVISFYKDFKDHIIKKLILEQRELSMLHSNRGFNS